jgi:hypothetical protein
MGKGKVPKWVQGLLLVGSLGGLLWLELRRPLRRSTESKLNRLVRNTALAVLGSAAIQLAEEPIIDRLLGDDKKQRWGLTRQLRLPPGLRALVAILLFDYTMYLWHVLTHRVRFLWRFHLVHHTDLDMDVSTALRFHSTVDGAVSQYSHPSKAPSHASENQDVNWEERIPVKPAPDAFGAEDGPLFEHTSGLVRNDLKLQPGLSGKAHFRV